MYTFSSNKSIPSLNKFCLFRKKGLWKSFDRQIHLIKRLNYSFSEELSIQKKVSNCLINRYFFLFLIHIKCG
jgi:hypothetical protein